MRGEESIKTCLHFYILALDQPTCIHEPHDRRQDQVSTGNEKVLHSSNSRKRRICSRQGRYRTDGRNVVLRLVALNIEKKYFIFLGVEDNRLAFSLT